MTYFQVDYDAAITPLPSAVAASGIPPKYPESRAGELILYTDPELSERLGYDLEAQNKMRIAPTQVSAQCIYSEIKKKSERNKK